MGAGRAISAARRAKTKTRPRLGQLQLRHPARGLDIVWAATRPAGHSHGLLRNRALQRLLRNRHSGASRLAASLALLATRLHLLPAGWLEWRWTMAAFKVWLRRRRRQLAGSSCLLALPRPPRKQLATCCAATAAAGACCATLSWRPKWPLLACLIAGLIAGLIACPLVACSL